MSHWYALVDLLPFEWAVPGEMLFIATTTSKIRASRPTFAGSTDRMSPTSRALKRVKDRPFRVDKKMPKATAVEEKTPITVSLARAEGACWSSTPCWFSPPRPPGTPPEIWDNTTCSRCWGRWEPELPD